MRRKVTRQKTQYFEINEPRSELDLLSFYMGLIFMGMFFIILMSMIYFLS